MYTRQNQRFSIVVCLCQVVIWFYISHDAHIWRRQEKCRLQLCAHVSDITDNLYRLSLVMLHYHDIQDSCMGGLYYSLQICNPINYEATQFLVLNGLLLTMFRVLAHLNVGGQGGQSKSTLLEFSAHLWRQVTLFEINMTEKDFTTPNVSNCLLPAFLQVYEICSKQYILIEHLFLNLSI